MAEVHGRNTVKVHRHYIIVLHSYIFSTIGQASFQISDFKALGIYSDGNAGLEDGRLEVFLTSISGLVFCTPGPPLAS